MEHNQAIRGSAYQAEAEHIVDYQLYQIAGSGEYFRGPEMVLAKENYVAFLGGAQTFGTFARYPFPSLVVERTGLACANLGIGGAGPGRFLDDPALMQIVNGARMAVVQVMSGRSVPNSLYENRRGTAHLRPRDQPGAPWVLAERVWEELFSRLPRSELAELIAETREAWGALMKQLLIAIEVPQILLWISSRRPEFAFNLSSVKSALGGFPHFIDRAMLSQVAPLADTLVEAVLTRGLRQPLFDRHTGAPASVNRWFGTFSHNLYPSPEMHVDIAEALTPAIRRFLSREAA